MAVLPTLLAALAAAAPAPAPVFAPARPVTAPIPAGDVRYTANADAPVLARRAADGVVFVSAAPAAAPSFALPLAAPVARGRWRYRDWWAADLTGDNRTDLLGRDGRTLLIGRGLPGGGWAPPRRWSTIPRGYAVVGVADVAEEEYQGVPGVYARNPRSGRVEVLERGDAEPMGAWPRGLSYRLGKVNLDETTDAVGYDRRRGVVRVIYNRDVTFGASQRRWRIPPRADLVVGDVNGDQLADLIYRPAGGDAVSIRFGRRVANPGVSAFRFLRARHAGRWDRRRPLTAAPLGLTTALATRDPRSGRIVAAPADRRVLVVG
jgi:hypothetical protein